MKNREIINEVKRIILKYANPSRIYLYGSRASGDAKENSDIDIAYMDENFKENFLIKEEVEKLSTLLKIDVSNLAQTEERFKNRVISSGKVLYSSNKKLRAEDGLHNFIKAFDKFSSVVGRKKEFDEQGYSDVYLDLTVKRFEFTFEMSWKAIRRVLDFLGIECNNPRSCYKEAYSQGLINNEAIWLEMIEMRNLSSHIYDEEEIREILDRIKDYNKAFKELKKNLVKIVK